ncbi:TspO/MBR family protein [Imperialibacter roseus]|uniref:TspO/MBR family protein n=1 Tax=Imperialibacter roseus TaxID=1324217 RepID=A0ABZ0IUS3_9BACT|nr:TspO/MBR family protein [Imperialibacter roseus]WOK08247.1 TspO/MBR family protein [Imperialibacter roseus]
MASNKTIIIRVAVSIIVCLAVGALSGIATSSSVSTWYTTLNKPPFNPPNWLFAPVWTLLYAMMGVAAGLVWSGAKESIGVKLALGLFVGQLLLNSLWSVLFFGLRNPTAALVEIVVLWVAILLTINRFYLISKTAAWLLVPYLIWVSFAALLNASIVILN